MTDLEYYQLMNPESRLGVLPPATLSNIPRADLETPLGSIVIQPTTFSPANRLLLLTLAVTCNSKCNSGPTLVNKT